MPAEYVHGKVIQPAAYFRQTFALFSTSVVTKREIQRMNACTFVRISCRSHAEAKELALRLEADGYHAVVRRWRTVIASTEPGDEVERMSPERQVGVSSSTSLLWGGPRKQLATGAQGASITPSAASSLWPWV
jgi:hypothetical protein